MSLGVVEILILLGIGVFGLAGIGVLFLVIWAAVRSGNRGSIDGKK